jgi:DNA modification methylase
MLIKADSRYIPLADNSVDCCVTSPPYYGLRKYDVGDRQIGLEKTPSEYVQNIVQVFREVRRVLKPTGTCWLNLGDSYANDGKWGGHTGGKHVRALHGSPIGRDKKYTGFKPKDLMMIPASVAIALREDGWYLRSDIIWQKPNPLPESVLDRCTRSHEHLFMLTKSWKYFYNAQAIAEPLTRPEESERKKPARFGGADKFSDSSRQSRLHSGNEYKGTATGTRNKRDVWTISPSPYKGAHFAVMPPKLVEPCILAGSPLDGIVLDPFGGSGTTAEVAARLGRRYVSIDLGYHELAKERLSKPTRPVKILPDETGNGVEQGWLF